MDTPPIARLSGVTMRGRRSERLKDVTLALSPGVTAVMGPSGAGKTSLLNLLVGFETPHSGRVERSGAVSWVPSNLGLWPGFTVRQHLEAVSEAPPPGLLEELGLGGLEDAYPHTLSLGQRTRLAVARALATPSTCLVMDEPLAHVDIPSRPGYWDVICRSLAGRSLIFSSHESETVLARASQVCFLLAGRVVFLGEVREFYERPPSETLSRFLGPGNWFAESGEQLLWLGSPEVSGVPLCVRPEALAVRPMPGTSAFRCLHYRSLGLLAESLIRHDPSGQERAFVHRPNSDLSGKAGIPVCLQWLALLVVCCALMACGGAPDLPRLEMRTVQTWRLPIDGPKLPAPRSVAIGPEDTVVVLDDAGRVLVFDRDGKLERRWRMPDVSVGRPEGVVVFPDGEIVVCDTHYHRVTVFDREGNVLRHFGRRGRGPGEFLYPVAVARDASDHLYIGEYGSNDRIQKFTRRGEHLLTFGSFGTEPGQFQRPSGIAWHAGTLFVADAVNNRIQAFQDDGTFLQVIPVTRGDRAVPLHLPYDLVLDPSGGLCIVEYGAGRLLRCTRDGALLGVFGKQGGAIGDFNTPWGIAVDSRGHLRVADTGNRRLVALDAGPLPQPSISD